MEHESKERRTAGLIARRIVYSLVVSGAILFAVSRVVTFFELRGAISLDTKDSAIAYMSGPPYVLDGEHYVTSPTMRRSLIMSRFRAVKGDAWRMFVLGESFAMGTPYVLQGRPSAGEGGISSWLAAYLGAAFPSQSVEVINAAAGGQNSNRVRLIAEDVLSLHPDALVVATCNNEGVLPPGRIDEILHQTGAYRLLAKMALPEVRDGERSYFTPQDPDLDAIREAFETNVHAILEAARAASVPVLLCTMPVNLRYDGGGAGHLLDDKYPDGKYTEPEPSECTKRATARRGVGDAAGALAVLDGCQTDLEGLRVRGLALFDLRRYPEAHAVLASYTELVPRNRCRPSLNRIIREQAQRSPGTHLVDLEAAAEALSPGGVPGDELFFDYCHMRWEGYAAMADAIRKTMRDASIVPGGREQTDRLPSRQDLAARFGLLDVTDDFLRSVNK